MRTRTISLLLTASLMAMLVSVARADVPVAVARSNIEKIKSMKDDVTPDKEKAKLLDLASKLLDACGNVSSAVADCGAELASTSGPYGSERAALLNVAKALASEAETAKKECDRLQRDVSMDQCRDVRGELDRVLNAWNAFSKQVDDTRKWLSVGLTTATQVRDNAVKAAELPERAAEESAKKVNEGREKHKAAFMKTADSYSAMVELGVKRNEAFAKWKEAENNGEGAEKVRALEQTHRDIHVQYMESEKNHWETFQEWRATGEELDRTMRECAEADKTLRAVLEDMLGTNPDRAWNEFRGWTEMFEKDCGKP